MCQVGGSLLGAAVGASPLRSVLTQYCSSSSSPPTPIRPDEAMALFSRVCQSWLAGWQKKMCDAMIGRWESGFGSRLIGMPRPGHFMRRGQARASIAPASSLFSAGNVRAVMLRNWQYLIRAPVPRFGLADSDGNLIASMHLDYPSTAGRRHTRKAYEDSLQLRHCTPTQLRQATTGTRRNSLHRSV